MSTTNKAAWADAGDKPLRVGEAPDWTVDLDEVKIHAHAVGLCPADYLPQAAGFVKSWPHIFGIDVAGEVVEVGSNVTRFKKGDRVVGHPPGAFGARGNKSGAFQNYPVVAEDRVAKIPDNWSYTDASVFPLAVATAAAGLYGKGTLELSLPQSPPAQPNGKYVVIWGAASSVGISAIQLALHAGYEIITTASPKNFDYVKSFGVKYVFDYNSPSVIDDIASALKGHEADYVGAFAAAGLFGNDLPVVHVGPKLGLKESIVSTANPRQSLDGLPVGVKVTGIIANQIFTSDATPGFPNEPEISNALFGSWLTATMAAGSLKVAPRPTVVGKGLEFVAVGYDRARNQGVSNEKLVIELD